MSRYMLTHFLKFAEVDNFENGCNPDTGYMSEISAHLTSDTPEGIVKKAFQFLCIDEDEESVQRNACDEPGRLDFAVLENADGMQASPREIEAWKRNEIKLWYAIYTCYVEKTEPFSF